MDANASIDAWTATPLLPLAVVAGGCWPHRAGLRGRGDHGPAGCRDHPGRGRRRPGHCAVWCSPPAVSVWSSPPRARPTPHLATATSRAPPVRARPAAAASTACAFPTCPSPPDLRRAGSDCAATSRSIVVRRGDCLWSLAADLIGPAAGASDVAAAAHALYRGNRHAGRTRPEPDLSRNPPDPSGGPAMTASPDRTHPILAPARRRWRRSTPRRCRRTPRERWR